MDVPCKVVKTSILLSILILRGLVPMLWKVSMVVPPMLVPSLKTCLVDWYYSRQRLLQEIPCRLVDCDCEWAVT